MKTLTTGLLWLLGLTAGLILLCVVAGLTLAWTLAPVGTAVVQFSDQAMTAQQLSVPVWLALAAALALAALVVSTVVPLTLLGVGLALVLGLGLPLLLVAGMGLLLAAPVLLVVWLVWLMVRRGSRPTAT